MTRARSRLQCQPHMLLRLASLGVGLLLAGPGTAARAGRDLARHARGGACPDAAREADVADAIQAQRPRARHAHCRGARDPYIGTRRSLLEGRQPDDRQRLHVRRRLAKPPPVRSPRRGRLLGGQVAQGVLEGWKGDSTLEIWPTAGLSRARTPITTVTRKSGFLVWVQIQTVRMRPAFI